MVSALLLTLLSMLKVKTLNILNGQLKSLGWNVQILTKLIFTLPQLVILNGKNVVEINFLRIFFRCHDPTLAYENASINWLRWYNYSSLISFIVFFFFELATARVLTPTAAKDCGHTTMAPQGLPQHPGEAPTGVSYSQVTANEDLATRWKRPTFETPPEMRAQLLVEGTFKDRDMDMDSAKEDSPANASAP